MARSRSSSAEPWPVLMAEEMREVERASFGTGEIGERTILESAGRAVAHAVAEHFPCGVVVGAIGRGNNGGDAIVALRTLRAWGRPVIAVPIGGASLPPSLVHGWDLATDTEDAFDGAGVIVDGMLGTGASGPPREAVAAAIGKINGSGRPVVAVDGPSGVDLTTGLAPGEAVQAALTVTFGALKRGHLLYPGRRFAGRLLLAEVGFPPNTGDAAGAAVITEPWARARIPLVAPDAHKGSVGLVAIVAGRTGVGGAPIMAAMGALRAGCGGVRIVSSDANRVAIHSTIPEAIFVDRDLGPFDAALEGTRALLAGPGIGTDESARRLLASVIDTFHGPIVLDADAITLLAEEPGSLPMDAASRCILTPHPAELARLLNCSTEDVLADRFGSASAAAERFGCAVLSKGAPSLVALPAHPVLVGTSGYSGVAAAGMGDTLAGVVAAFLARGADRRTAAAIGLHFAGRAAEAAGRGRGLLPRDVAEALPEVLGDSVADTATNPPFHFDLRAAE